jgi:putative transposase
LPTAIKYKAIFHEDHLYHVFNETNNHEKLFLNDENRRFFLQKIKEYLSPIVKIYGWNLLNDHFHLLIKTKSLKSITAYLNSKPPGSLTNTELKFLNNTCTLHDLINNIFKRFFQSYSMAFNKVHSRRGNLFHKSYKRLALATKQFIEAFVYVLMNSVKHKVETDFEKYRWSCWNELQSNAKSILAKTEVVSIFGGLRTMINLIKGNLHVYYHSLLSIER